MHWYSAIYYLLGILGIAHVCPSTLGTCVTMETHSLDLTKIPSCTSDMYVSFSMDVSQIVGPERDRRFNYSSPRLQTLLQAMSPAIWRVGGSPADWLIFDKSPVQLNASGVQPTPVVMTKLDWDNLVKLTTKAGIRLLFDLDLQMRFGTQWDPSNAIELMDYSASQGYGENLDWELGNEPNAYVRPGQAKLKGSQVGHDFLSLTKLVRSYSNMKNSRVVGPDVVGFTPSGKDIFKGVLDIAGHAMDAMTVHQYYFRGDKAKWTEYINPSHFNVLATYLNEVKSLIKSSKSPEMPIWIGETSDAWHGGTLNVSDRYVSAFLWLDKLGLAAQNGVDVVMRQTFWGHNYGLIGLDDLLPNPDYWLSLLHKQLVGTRVLGVTTSLQPHTTRVYCHCASTRKYQAGAVVIFALNVNQTVTDHITFKGPLSKQKIDLYLMTPYGKQGLLSRVVMLNTHVLQMIDDHTMPSLDPVRVSASQGIKLPPTTYAFLVFPQADLAVCKK